MRYLVVSSEGRSVGLARKLEAEGHAAFMHIIKPNCQRKGAGIVSVIKTPRPIMDGDGVYNLSAIDWLMSTARPDITIFDSPTTHVMATRMQQAGHRVIGTTSDVKDRAQRALNVGRSYVEAYFNGQRFLEPFTFFVPYLNLFNENLGPICPSMGAMGKFLDRSSSVSKLLTAVEPELRSTSYRGPVTASLTQDMHLEAYYTDLSESNFLLYEALQGSLSQLFVDVVNGIDQDHDVVEPYAIAVRTSLPPFPYTQDSRAYSTEELTIEGIDDGNLKHLYPNDLCMNQGRWTTTAESNDIGTFTARGSSVREAQRRVYRTVKNIRANALQYRTDIGSLSGISAIQEA